MDKQQIISFIKSQISSGKISKADLLSIDSTDPAIYEANIINPEKGNESRNLTNVFYVIGGIIAVIGVIILLGQHWRDIGFMGRISVTLGIGLITYISALLMGKEDNRVLSQLMFTISAVLSPAGIFILLQESKLEINTDTVIMISLAFAVVYGFALFVTRRNITSVFTAVFLTWTYYSFLTKLFDTTYFYNNSLFQWATMLIGVAYLVVGYSYSSLIENAEGANKGEKIAIQNLFYTAGTVAVLGSGISIDGFDLIFIAVIFAAFYLSVYVRNTSILILSGMFLIAHIFKLTYKYFADMIDWPIALILSGFLVIGIGYFTYYLNNKYIRIKK